MSSSSSDSSAQREQRFGLGIVLMIVAVGFFSSMTASIKHLTGDYSIFMILFARSAVALPIATIWLLWIGGILAFRSHRPDLQALRNGLGIASNLCLYFALGSLTLADATAIQFTAPLMITALSALVLKDRIGPRRWIAVVIGFAGVLFMASPSGELQWASLVLLCATLGYALMVIVTRVLSRYDSPAVIFFYLNLCGLLVGAAALPWVGVIPPVEDLLVMLLVGLFGAGAQVCLVSAIRVAPPSVITPFDYTLMLWALGYDILLWGIEPQARTLIGATIIAGAGLYVAQRESGCLTILWRTLRGPRG